MHNSSKSNQSISTEKWVWYFNHTVKSIKHVIDRDWINKKAWWIERKRDNDGDRMEVYSGGCTGYLNTARAKWHFDSSFLSCVKEITDSVGAAINFSCHLSKFPDPCIRSREFLI